MKKSILYLFALLILFACGGGGGDKKDTNADNIQPESATKKVAAVQHFPVSEDLTELDNSIITESPYTKLEQAVQAKLQSSGKSLGTFNSDGSIYMVGSASVVVPSNQNGFITSRNIAFSKAELSAKIEILKAASLTVRNSRGSSLMARSASGNDPALSEKASFIEKLGIMADKAVDNALAELGMSEAEIASLNQSEREKLFEEKYNDEIVQFVSSMINGASVVKIAEGELGNNDYEVAVCVKYSPEQHAESLNMEQLGASQETLNSDVVNNLRGLSPEKLMSKLGAQFFKDENGNRFVVGFGQASVQKSDTRQSTFVNIGRKTARAQAIASITNLLAEDLTGKQINENTEQLTKYRDGQESLYTESVFTELIKSNEKSVKISVLDLKDWIGNHPVSKSLVVGKVVILSKSANMALNALPSSADKKSSTQKSEVAVSKDIEGEEF